MHFVMWKATKGYENALFPSIARGAFLNGDHVEMRELDSFEKPEGDAGFIIGVVRREVLWAYQKAGIPIAYMDKGYIRERMHWHDLSMPAWWRLCWNDTHPTNYFMKHNYPDDRARLGHVIMQERKTGGRDVLILGSSQKFHHTHGLPHPTEWAEGIVSKVQRLTDRRIVYRPKPSWKWATPIEGAAFDHGNKRPIDAALADAFCSITYGSIAGVDSILGGVPCTVLGNSVASPVGGEHIESINNPYWASTAERLRWISNLSYYHWRPTEIEDGTAWCHLKEQMRYAF